MKARVEQSGQSFEEAVTVNQRGLIDKILARYSTKLTLFRELLQNANDAKASELEIRFSGTKRMKDGSSSFEGLHICNNGMVFRAEDWNRIKSIADGNPDETKVGFFGVGFYSVFSLSDEPTVLSGEHALSFFWKKNALFVTHGSIPKPMEQDSEGVKKIFELVKNGWTVFDLPVRADPPFPVLPDASEMAEFLLQCLTFTGTLESVRVYYDNQLALTVGLHQNARSVSPIQYPGNPTDPRSIFRFKGAYMESLLFAVQFNKRKEDVVADHHSRNNDANRATGTVVEENPPVVVEMMRVNAQFSVHVDEKFKSAMFRVTKKNPPKDVTVQLLFDIGGSTMGSKELEMFSPGSHRGGFFFIGSGVTQQSTGNKCHCNGPFMPTMERNAMDLSDITLATWNRALLYVTGILQRITYEHRCLHDISVQKTDSSPNKKLFEQFWLAKAKEEAAMGDNEEKQDSTKAEDQRKRKEEVRMFSSMAAFAMKKTTPVVQVGDMVLAGFFGVTQESPLVMTTNGPKRASESRLKDETGLHELVTKTVSIVKTPEPLSKGDDDQLFTAEKLVSKARSAVGFFTSLFGSSEGTVSSSSSSYLKKEGNPHDSMVTLCNRFVDELRKRQLLRELNVADLAEELKSRPLTFHEVNRLLKWLIHREQTYQEMQKQQQQEMVYICCDWCGNGMGASVKALRIERDRIMQQQQSNRGFFQAMMSTSSEPVRVHLKCSRCSQHTSIDPDKEIPKVSMPSSFSNAVLLKLVTLESGPKLASFSMILPQEMKKRIVDSSNKFILGDIETLFWSSPACKKSVLPKEIADEFASNPKKLLNLVNGWLRPISWTMWWKYCFQTYRKRSDHLEMKDMALVSNMIRVLAFAKYHGNIPNEDVAILESTLSSEKLFPVRTMELMKPSETYLGAEATGGFKSLPIIALCEALEDGSFTLLDGAPKDRPVVDFLLSLGAKKHVELGFLFQEFNKGSLGWNRQEILHYIGSILSKLSETEINRLKNISFLPKLEVNEEGKCIPTMRSFKPSELYVCSHELHLLGLPVVYAIVEEGLPVVQTGEKIGFFEFSKQKIPNNSLELLHKIGIRSYPTLSVLMDAAARGGEPGLAAIRYISSNFDRYKRNYNLSTDLCFIPCRNGTLQSPKNSFLNPKAEILGLPTVDRSKITVNQAEVFGVAEDPKSGDIRKCLQKTPPTWENACKVFEYCSSLMTKMDKSDLWKLRAIKFIPLDEQSTKYVTPQTTFFKPAVGKPGRYEGLFPYICYPSEAANMFLRAVGVRNEPTPDELAKELAVGNAAQDLVDRIGFSDYLRILKLIAVQWDSVTTSTKSYMRESKCLIGMKQKEDSQSISESSSTSSSTSSGLLLSFDGDDAEDETNDATKKEEDELIVDYLLEYPRNIFINDQDVLSRMFNPITVPQESIFESMYSELGSKSLSSAVDTKTSFKKPFTVTSTTRELEETLRKRLPLFTFKRRKSDFVNINDCFKFFNSGEHFVLQVPHIIRTYRLGGLKRDTNCSAAAYLQNGTYYFLVTANFSTYEFAGELCKVLLRKSTLHDNLLWEQLIKSSDELLRQQGFPIQRKVVVAPPPTPAPEPPQVQQKQQPQETEQVQDVAKQEQAMPQQQETAKQVSTPNPAPVPPPATPDTIANDPKKLAQDIDKLLDSPKKKNMIKSLLSTASKAFKSKRGDMEGKDPEELRKLYEKFQNDVPPVPAPSSSSQQQQQASTPPPHHHQQQQQRQGQKTDGGSSLLVDRNARAQSLQNALRKCNAGGQEQHIQSQQERVSMETVMDDLHPHDLVKTQFNYCGIDCYVERDGSSDPDVYRVRSVEATVFAQLLIDIAVSVFGITKSAVHLYYHHGGPTAAFNRGGALFFNLDTFLSQLDKSNWHIRTTMGADMQPKFIVPAEGVIDWYAVFAHELAHNAIHVHDAQFANWMMMYFTTFLPTLNVLIDSYEKM